jgi:hypothetical protein
MAPESIAAAVARYLDAEPQRNLDEARAAVRRTIESTGRILAARGGTSR